MLLQFLSIFFLLFVGSIGPGLFLVRRMPWTPAEKLSAALGLSCSIIYVTSFVIFLATRSADQFRSCALTVSLACFALTVWCFKDLLALWRNREVRHQLAAFVILFVWGLLLLALVRNYSGGVCSQDWLEHYQRAAYFIVHPSSEAVLISRLPIPSRPPLMNLVAAHYLAQVGLRFDLLQVGLRFELFQVIFLFLNLLIIFPLSLMLRLFARRGAANWRFLVIFLMANPLFWWNVTWTWTKVFTGFYIIVALWFYLAGLRKADPLRVALAFLFLAVGFLSHFSAGPYALAIGVHYLVFVFRGKRSQWLAVLGGGAAALALLTIWFGYSVTVFGFDKTFGSNTTMLGFGSASPAQNAQKIAGNIFYSFIPHPFRVSKATFDDSLGQPSALGYLRDYVLTMLNPNFILAMGAMGGLLVLYLLTKTFRGPPKPNPGATAFWITFITISGLVGIAAHPTLDVFGVAHICGQPLIYLGLAFLAARFLTLPLVLRWLAVAGCLFDFSLGVWLHFHLENQPIQLTALTQPSPEAFAVSGWISPDNQLSKWAGFNWIEKTSMKITFLGDHCVRLVPIIQFVLPVGFALGLFVLIRASPRTIVPARHRASALDTVHSET
jgi:hypothetical protein